MSLFFISFFNNTENLDMYENFYSHYNFTVEQYGRFGDINANYRDTETFFNLIKLQFPIIKYTNCPTGRECYRWNSEDWIWLKFDQRYYIYRSEFWLYHTMYPDTLLTMDLRKTCFRCVWSLTGAPGLPGGPGGPVGPWKKNTAGNQKVD